MHAFPVLIHSKNRIITEARLDKREYSVSLSSNNDVAKNAKEKDHRDFSIDSDLRPSASSSLLIMIPRRFSRSEPLSTPSPPNIPDIIWTATVDHLFSSFSLFSSGYYETRFQRKMKAGEGSRKVRQEKAVENVGRVPARHCHFHRIAAFPRLFLLLSCLFLAATPRRAVSFHYRAKSPLLSAAMKIRCSLFAAKRTHAGRSSGCFNCSICREAHGRTRCDRRYDWIIRLSLKINM